MRIRRLTLIIIAILVLLGTGGVIAITVAGPALSAFPPIEQLYLRYWLGQRQEVIDTPASSDSTLQTFAVNPGDTAQLIGNNLLTGGLITDAEVFTKYARYHGLDSQLEAGTYFLSGMQTIPEIVLILTDSSTASITFTVLEGWRREEISGAIDANPLLTFSGAEFFAVTSPGAAIDPATAAYLGLPSDAGLEGFLYPETYFLPPNTTAQSLRDTLIAMFIERVGSDLKTAAEAQGLTLFQATIFASIVEREAVRTDEQPLIASVYRNRLDIGMNLDADPTVQYGIGYRDNSWWPSITQDDYRTAVSPYNTYINPGLPPGPIANAHVSAIQAAIFPQESPYFYFRASCIGDGYHMFAVTFDEHVANGNCQ